MVSISIYFFSVYHRDACSDGTIFGVAYISSANGSESMPPQIFKHNFCSFKNLSKFLPLQNSYCHSIPVQKSEYTVAGDGFPLFQEALIFAASSDNTTFGVVCKNGSNKWATPCLPRFLNTTFVVSKIYPNFYLCKIATATPFQCRNQSILLLEMVFHYFKKH